MTVEDLEGYNVTIDEPFKFEYRGQTIISAPPPASGKVHQVWRKSKILTIPLPATVLINSLSLQKSHIQFQKIYGKCLLINFPSPLQVTL